MTDKNLQAAQKLLEGYKDLIGQAAEGIFKRKEYIEIEEGEVVEFSGDQENLLELIEDVKSNIGAVANRIAKKKLEEIEDAHQKYEKVFEEV